MKENLAERRNLQSDKSVRIQVRTALLARTWIYMIDDFRFFEQENQYDFRYISPTPVLFVFASINAL